MIRATKIDGLMMRDDDGALRSMVVRMMTTMHDDGDGEDDDAWV